MTSLGTLSVKLDAKTAAFERKMTSVQGKLEGVANKLKPIAKMATAAFAGMAAAMALVTKAASEQREAELKLASAIEGTGMAINIDKIKEYAAELQKVTTFGDEVTISAAAMLATFQLNEDQIIGLLPRIQNLSALYGMDLSQAALAMGKAMTMGAGALSRYGIVMSDAEKKAFNMATQTEKVATLMTLLDKNTGPAAEMMAKTAKGAMLQLKNATGDLAEQLGFIIESPIIEKLTSLKNMTVKLTSWIDKLSPGFKSLAANAAMFALDAVAVTAAIAGIGIALPFVVGGLKAFGLAITGTILPAIPMIFAVAAAIAGVILIVGALKKAWEEDLGGIATFLKKQVKLIKEEWLGMFKTVGEKAKKFFQGLSEFAVTASAFIIGATPDEAFDMLKEVQKDGGIAGKAGAALAKGADKLIEGGKSVAKDLKDTFLNGLEGFDQLFQKIFDMIPTVDDLVKPPTLAAAPIDLPGLPPLEEKKEKDKKIVTAAEALTNTVTNSMGNAGTLISGALEAASGDLIGGGIAMLTAFISESAALQGLFKIIGNLFSKLVKILDPFIKPFMPLIEGLSKIALVMFQLLMIINPWVMAFRVIVNVFLYIGKGVQWFADKLIQAWNWVVEQFAKLIGKIRKKWGESIMKQFMIKWEDEIIPPPEEKTQDFTGTIDKATVSVNKFDETIQKASASMLNMPKGFKLALTRFRATEGESPAALIGASGAMAGGISIDNVNVVADDPQELVDALKREAEWDAQKQSGSPISGGPRLSTPKHPY